MTIRGYAIATAVAIGSTMTPGLGSMSAQATEGYFQHGYGVVSKSLAGAGVAYSQDAMAQVLNPAGLVNVENQLNVGVSFFSPHREFEASGGTNPAALVPNDTVKSDRELFIIPNIGASYAIDDVSAIGASLYGNGGMNTTYDDGATTCTLALPGVFCDGETGVDLTQVFLQFTYAREIIDGVSIGGGPIVAAQRFAAKGLDFFAGFSSDPDNLSDNGHEMSYGVGARVGVQAELPFGLSLGAAYQLRTYMTKFDDYRGLFSEQGDFDIPPALQVGLSWKPIEDVTFLFDYKRIWYSKIDSVGTKFFIPGPGDQLGDDDGPGFGWDDTDTFKFGLQWDVDEKWTLRGGYSYTDQPIGSSEVLFNILAPGVIKHHITAGISYDLNDAFTLHLGGFYAPSSSVSGENPFDPGQRIKLKMYQYEVSAGVAWRF